MARSWLTVQNILRGNEGLEERKQYLTSRLWELRRDAPHVDEGVTDILSPGMAPAFGPGQGRRGKPGGPDRRGRSNQQPAKLEPGLDYRPDRKFITPEEFQKPPDKGVIDPQSVRTSQEKFSDEFGVPIIPGVPESRKVDYIANGLKDRKFEPNIIEPIELVEWKGYVYTVDHRRLIAFRRAGVEIPFKKVRIEDLSAGKQRRIRGAQRWNEDGAYIKSKITEEME